MHRHPMTSVAIVALTTTLTATADAQDLTPKAAPQIRPVVIQNATVHTVSGGVLIDGTVWFEDGVIRGVYPRGEAPAMPGIARGEVELLDGRGRHVYPGLITAKTTMGLEELGQVRQSVDTTELGAIKPEVRAAVAVNPDSTVLPVSRTAGILTMGVFPLGGLVAGRVSVMNLDGWTVEDMTILGDAGLAVNWPRNADGEQTLTDTFDQGRAWLTARATDPSTPTDIRWQAMGPVLERQRPVFATANSVDEIQQAVSWAEAQAVDLVVVGGREARLCLDTLVRHEVAVMLLGTHRLPSRRDSPIDEPFTLPLALHEAGLTWCLASGDSFYNERNLPYHAATAVAYGLPEDEALRAITLYAAQILGVDDRVGSIEVGKDATLLITDGSPLDLTTAVTQAYVRGRRVSLSNKQSELYQKYRERYRQMGLIR